MKTLEHAILNHARLYLGLTEPYQHELSRGLCFGLSATAVVYNAVNQFADYKGLLETLVSSNATPNLALRRLIEAAFFLQSLNLQTMVTGTNRWSQNFMSAHLLAPVHLSMAYYQLNREALWQLLLNAKKLAGHHLIKGLLVKRNDCPHIIAFIPFRNDWYVVDSLGNAVAIASQGTLGQISFEPGELIQISVAHQQGLNLALLNTNIRRLSARERGLYARSATPWLLINFGKNKTETCTQCHKTKTSRFHDTICHACYMVNSKKTQIGLTRYSKYKLGY